MTWLAHYAQLGGAIERHEVHYGPVPGMFRLGAKSLAAHLGFDAQRLEGLIKDRLLVTAQSWMSDVERRNQWISSAYPFLQKEIYLAVEWLCLLTNKTLDYYFHLWRYTRMGHHSWAKLHAVLPFEYYGMRDTFLQFAPFYLKAFNQQLAELYRLNDDGLSEVVDVIRLNSRHFNSFMGAFKKLHDGLQRHCEADVIDFRDRRPLDYYLLLAIRAETCLREELQRVGTLDKIKVRDQNLGGYLLEFGSKVGLDKNAIKFLGKGMKNAYVQLRAQPSDVIANVRALQVSDAPAQNALVQAMVCCELARNYFAHHDYLDTELLNNPDSAFLLGGILVCVLVFLGNQQT